MRGDFIYRHREELRLELHTPKNETLPIPVKHFAVMRRRRSNTDNVLDNVIPSTWTEAMDVNLSEDWTGTARFQILRTRLEGHIWVSGRPTKIQKITRQASIWPEACMQLSKNSSKKKLQIGRKKMPNCREHTATQIYEVSIDSKDYLKVNADARLQFEKGLGPAMPFIMREDSKGVDYPLSQVDHKWHVGQR